MANTKVGIIRVKVKTVAFNTKVFLSFKLVSIFYRLPSIWYLKEYLRI